MSKVLRLKSYETETETLDLRNKINEIYVFFSISYRTTKNERKNALNSQNENNLRNRKSVLNNGLSTVYALLKKRRISRRKCSEIVVMMLQYNQKMCPVTCNTGSQCGKEKETGGKERGEKKDREGCVHLLNWFSDALLPINELTCCHLVLLPGSGAVSVDGVQRK